MDRDPEELRDDEDLPADLTEPVDVEADVPEADALDQHRATGRRDEPDVDVHEIRSEVPEADALDQARSVPDDEDDREA